MQPSRPHRNILHYMLIRKFIVFVAQSNCCHTSFKLFNFPPPPSYGVWDRMRNYCLSVGSFYNFNLFVLFCFLKMHLRSAFLFMSDVKGQNAAWPTAQTEMKVVLEENLQKDSATGFEPQTCGVTFCGLEKDIVDRPEPNFTILYVHPTVCLLYSALITIFRVVNNASLPCVAQWYYLFTMFHFLWPLCILYTCIYHDKIKKKITLDVLEAILRHLISSSGKETARNFARIRIGWYFIVGSDLKKRGEIK